MNEDMLPKEMQMCTPDWLESPKNRFSPLQIKIRRAAAAKRRRAREEFKRFQAHLSLKERGISCF